jgi:chromosome segregation ATPase
MGPSSARDASPTRNTAASRSSAARSSTPTTPPGISRSRSTRGTNGTPISARAAVKKPGLSTASAAEEDSRAETNLLMDDLKEQLRKAEVAAEEARRHGDALQARLEDATREQSKQEERIHEDEERIEELENAKRELTKQKRELEAIYEAEHAAVMKDREASISREEELQTIVQRLKDSLSQKESLRPPGAADQSLSRNSESPLCRTMTTAMAMATTENDTDICCSKFYKFRITNA